MTMDEHIDCDRQLNEAEERIKIVANALNERIKKLEAENEQLKKQIGDLRATAVRKGLMKGGSFTGKT